MRSSFLESRKRIVCVRNGIDLDEAFTDDRAVLHDNPTEGASGFTLDGVAGKRDRPRINSTLFAIGFCCLPDLD
jgi:hypothetical protein